MREISTLLNAEVISIKEGKKLGAISQVVYDLSTGKLVGLIVGKGAAEKGILTEDIEIVGPDVVMVDESSVARRLTELPDLMRGRRDPSQPPQQVVTDGGQRLGRLGRVYLDTEKSRIGHFEVSGGTWRDLTEGVLSMPVVKGIIHGSDTIIVPSNAVSQATETPGLRDSIEEAGEAVRESAVEGAKQVSKAVESGAEVLKRTLSTPLGAAASEKKASQKPKEEPSAAARKPGKTAAKEPAATKRKKQSRGQGTKSSKAAPKPSQATEKDK